MKKFIPFTAALLAASVASAQNVRAPSGLPSSELAELRSLGRLTQLSGLGGLAGLARLSDLALLAELPQLEGLARLSSLDQLSQLRGLTGLPELRELRSIERTEPLGRLELRGRTSRRGPAPSWNAEDPADSLYRLARGALNDGDYRRAQRLFAEIVERFPRSEYAGDALYWQAWAMYRYGQERGSVTRGVLESAVALLDRQASAYPDARTIRDARSLRARLRSEQMRQGDVEAGRETTAQAEALAGRQGCPGEDDDTRVIALQGLMQSDAESALPILKQVLARRDACSENLRKAAVLVLSQQRGDESADLLLQVARADPSSEVRAAAIQWLGQSHSAKALPVLDSILRSSNDNEVRAQAIFALSQQRDERAVAQSLRRVAEDERMPTDLRAQAIYWLGQSRGGRDSTAYLRDLFARTPNEELKEQILFAVSQSRDEHAGRWLMEVVNDRAQSTDIRKTALHWVSQQRHLEIAQLVKLYDDMRGQSEMQQQLVWALSQRRESEATDKLMDIAHRDPDRELRTTAVFWLSQKKNDPRVQKFLLDLING